ncbi:MAG: hypothetical protein ACRCSF_10175 [Mycobacteriaceae bacterium]
MLNTSVISDETWDIVVNMTTAAREVDGRSFIAGVRSGVGDETFDSPFVQTLLLLHAQVREICNEDFTTNTDPCQLEITTSNLDPPQFQALT